jgi:hypothetical protein
MRLETLKPEAVEEGIKAALDAGYQSAILTLVEGDTLIGDLFYYRDYPPEPKVYRPVGGFSDSLLPVNFIFNTSAGQIHGDAHFMRVPAEYIAGFRPLVWTRESLSALSLKNVPNPLATRLESHNLRVAKKYNIEVLGYCEKALSKDGIPPDGIRFTQDELIYVDWEFLSRSLGGLLTIGVNLGLVSGQVERQTTLYSIAHDRLKTGTIERFQQWRKSHATPGEQRVAGYLYMPDQETTTEIEGKACLVALCVEQRDGSLKQGFMPVILKRESLTYPGELLDCIASPLVFYGEVRQIPVSVGVLHSPKALMTRVIGYLTELDNPTKL